MQRAKAFGLSSWRVRPEKGGAARIAPDVKAGDKVLYGKYSGTEVTVDGEQYLILRESDVLAVLK